MGLALKVSYYDKSINLHSCFRCIKGANKFELLHVKIDLRVRRTNQNQAERRDKATVTVSSNTLWQHPGVNSEQ